MNIATYARGLLAELEGAKRNPATGNVEAVRGELQRVLDEARTTAVAEKAALDKGDPEAARYDSLIADLDRFAAGDAAEATDRPGKRTAAAAAPPEKA